MTVLNPQKPVKPEKLLAALEGGLSVLTDRKAWVQGTLAQDANGKNVSPLSKKAVTFCASAAIQKAINARESAPAFKAAITELNVTVGKLYSDFDRVEAMNDGAKGHKQVLRVYRETIKRVKKAQAEAKEETDAKAKKSQE
jgi:hypothetical protein